jgi:biofilm PGA synthesis protein PgaD
VRPFFTTLDTVTFYILVALVNGLVLIGWAKYNQFRFRVERRSRRPGWKTMSWQKVYVLPGSWLQS